MLDSNRSLKVEDRTKQESYIADLVKFSLSLGSLGASHMLVLVIHFQSQKASPQVLNDTATGTDRADVELEANDVHPEGEH